MFIYITQLYLLYKLVFLFFLFFNIFIFYYYYPAVFFSSSSYIITVSFSLFPERFFLVVNRIDGFGKSLESE